MKNITLTFVLTFAASTVFAQDASQVQKLFEAGQYPTVSPQHCDIILDRRCFTLRDHSRQGTLVNERPVVRQVALHSGDWIRLGPHGPLLRFLGKADRVSDLVGEKLAEQHVRVVLDRLFAGHGLAPRFALLVPMEGRPAR